MASIQQQIITKGASSVPKIAIGVLAAVAVLGVFVVGFDTGQLEQAFGISGGMNGNNPGIMWLHEFSHDARHAAGFMCH
jgi:putative cobalt transporter subunit CbtB